MKTPLLLLLLFLCCGFAVGRDQAALDEFEERVKQAELPQDASALTAEAMASKNYDQIEICLRYPLAASMIMGQYVEEPASEFKDRLTMDLLAQQWEQTTPEPGKQSDIPPEVFRPYLDYIQERLGEEVSVGSPEELMKAVGTPDDRDRLIRKFRGALVRAGHAEGKMTATRPRKDWTPGEDKDPAAAPGQDGNGATPWILGAGVLVAAAGAYLVLRRRAA